MLVHLDDGIDGRVRQRRRREDEERDEASHQIRPPIPFLLHRSHDTRPYLAQRLDETPGVVRPVEAPTRLVPASCDDAAVDRSPNAIVRVPPFCWQDAARR
jgi:hypothetical protein